MNQDIKQKISAFLKAIESAEKELPKFQERADRINEQVQRREATSDEIAELQDKRVPVESELATIRPAYMDALYNMNAPLQETLQDRKKELEAELDGLDQAIEQKRGELVPVDGIELAKLHAELDSFSTPNVLTFLRSLELPLIEEVNAINGRASGIANTLPYEYDEADYVAARGKLDEGYRVLREALAESERRAERVRQEPQPVGKEMARYLREEAIAAGAVGDRVGATVRDARLSDELDD